MRRTCFNTEYLLKNKLPGDDTLDMDRCVRRLMIFLGLSCQAALLSIPQVFAAPPCYSNALHVLHELLSSPTLNSSIATEQDLNRIIEEASLHHLADEDAIQIILNSAYVRNGRAKLYPISGARKFAESCWRARKVDSESVAAFQTKILKQVRKKLPVVQTGGELVDAIVRLKKLKSPPAEVLELLSNVYYSQYYGFSKESLLKIWDSVLALEGADQQSVRAIVAREYPALGSGSKSWDSAAGSYDKKLPTLPIRNQCNTGTCWLQAAATEKDQILRSKTGLDISVSSAYPFLQRVRRQFYQYLRNDSRIKIEGDKLWHFHDEKYVTDGGDFDEALALDLQNGVVPTSAWQPKFDPFDDESQSLLMNELERILKDYKKAMNAAARMNEASARLEVRSSLYRTAVQRMNRLMDGSFGALPDPDHFTFTVGSTTYTPRTFQQKFFPADSVHEYSRQQLPTVDEREISRYPEDPSGIIDVTSVRRNKLPISDREIDEKIIKQINEGHAVYLSYQSPVSKPYIEGVFVDHVSGKMEHASLPYENEGGHAVAVVGYELDPSGRLSRLMIQNSWGTSAGDGGIYHMDVKFLHKFFKELAIRSDAEAGQ